MIDPYQVLGIPRNASEEDIKKAYRKKAKQYHPDLHPNDPAAAKKMNEVNEAYDMLKNPEKYERKRAQEQQQNSYRQQQSYYNGYGSSGYSSGGYQQGRSSYGYNGRSYDYDRGGFGYGGFDFNDFFGGFGNTSRYDTSPHARSDDPAEMVRAINAINAGRYNEAVMILTAMTSSYRNARWYYLCAVAYKGTGDDAQALSMIQKAAQAEPGNQIYQQLYRQYSSSAQTGSYTGGGTVFSSMRIFGIVILLIFILSFLFRCMPVFWFF